MCVPNTHVLSLNSKVSLGMWDYFFSELGCLEQYVLTSYSENTTEPKQLNKFRIISFPHTTGLRALGEETKKTNKLLNLYLQPLFRPSLLVLTLVTLGKELLYVPMRKISD